MADQVENLVLDSLAKSLFYPDGLPLYKARGREGLFPRSSAGKKAAQLCLEQGLLVLDSHPAEERARLTARGEELLARLRHWGPVLEELDKAVRSLCSELTAQAQRMDELRHHLTRALEWIALHIRDQPTGLALTSLRAASTDGHVEQQIQIYLRQWEDKHPQLDCPFSELYAGLQGMSGAPAVGVFQDALRHLAARGTVCLHPWTGPLAEIPVPELAFLHGHALVYYASSRAQANALTAQVSQTQRGNGSGCERGVSLTQGSVQ
ncbi:MAG: hypothetical protein C4297_13235 [Gemmataceae bacterium]